MVMLFSFILIKMYQSALKCFKELMKTGVRTNEFFDINKLPTTEGVILFGISMSRIDNAQSAEKCFEYMKHLASKIEYTDGIALEMYYGDYLYFHSEDPSYKLRDRFKEQMISHRNAFMRREVVFILEEITMFYLSQKGLFRMNNRFVTDAEKTWTLQAYPGKPLKSEVYLFQKNPLNFSNPKNLYENCYYDLEGNILYDYSRLDIDTFDFSENHP